MAYYGIYETSYRDFTRDFMGFFQATWYGCSMDGRVLWGNVRRDKFCFPKIWELGCHDVGLMMIFMWHFVIFWMVTTCNNHQTSSCCGIDGFCWPKNQPIQGMVEYTNVRSVVSCLFLTIFKVFFPILPQIMVSMSHWIWHWLWQILMYWNKSTDFDVLR